MAIQLQCERRSPAHVGALMIILSVSPFQSDHQFLEASAAACKCQLAQAADLAEALAVLNQCEVSVVLCEHDLVRGDWRDLLRRLLELPHPAALIVTSRLADEQLWAEALNLGAWDVLAKPFDRTEVTRSIERACQHWYFASSARAGKGRSVAANETVESS